jgi:hypothetical protein
MLQGVHRGHLLVWRPRSVTVALLRLNKQAFGTWWTKLHASPGGGLFLADVASLSADCICWLLGSMCSPADTTQQAQQKVQE